MTVLDTLAPSMADAPRPTTVHLTGEIDIFSSSALRHQLINTLRHSTNVLVLNLSGVTFCDVSGLGVLVGARRRARSMGITLVLAAPRPFLSRLLHVTGLGRSLPTVA
ncbi:STAS domain-containing protein [Streptosporangium saharense]|uniref:Anti-sigma factor antagonist n=1 Tax=Streptosporangium saharense TaxID=1706840 RepID=A0A7W7VKP5_9ACTN|nr:STAS domain-containing protein [Streptosporangium saharense]MBB4913753.1 anti-sigma B factor antagonist [Streptosporangium saharense]